MAGEEVMKMPPTVHIRKEAFISLIFSVVDIFKKESFGFVLGYRPNKRRNYFLVTEFVPFANRNEKQFTGATWTRRTKQRFQRFQELISQLRLKYLGDFHSHPEFGGMICSTGLSDHDKAYMIKNGYDLEFIVGISSRRRGKAVWESMPDGSIKGSYDQFNIEVHVYTLVLREEDKDTEQERLQIVAPEAIKTLNRMHLRQ